ncbi:MAG: DUF120 domain-containing protein, partial [Candidatus Thermoplasmatota archaeon]
MKNYIHALKTIALLGGTKDYVFLSSKELGKVLALSQQSASRRIIEMVEIGFLERKMTKKKQGLIIAEKGLEALRKEYTDYIRIFEPKDKIIINGRIVSGIGEGSYYIDHENYKKQFIEKLSFSPYKGTLNLKLDSKELAKLKILNEEKGIKINGFHDGKRTFGDGKCFHAKIKNIKCAVVMPARTHHTDVIEI